MRLIVCATACVAAVAGMLAAAPAGAAVAGMLAAAPAGAADPPARVETVVDEHFGERVPDPYRWMEKVGPEFVTFAKTEDARTRGELKALPGYAKLLADTTRAVEATVQIGGVQVNGASLYYRKRGPGEAQASLYVRPLAGGAERKLVDPTALKGVTTAINEYAPSPDNRLLAYTLADGGSEEAILYVLDLKTGRTLPEAIDRARFAGATWSPDGTTLFYNRLKAGGTGAERFADSTVYRHTPGADPGRDAAVFRATDAGSALGRQAFVGLLTSSTSPYAVGIASSGVSQESEFYLAPLAQVQSGTPKWTRIAALQDKIEQFAVAADGHTAWMTSFRDAARRKLLKIDLDRPDIAHAAVVLPEGAGVLKQIGAARDGLYLIVSEGGAYRVGRLGADGKLKTAPPPFKGSIYSLAADPRVEGAAFGLESWIKPRDIFMAHGASVASLHLAPPFPLDLTAFTSETIEATAKDGAKIPIDVVYRKDLRRDGSNSTLVDGYGAYGEAVDAAFMPDILSFLIQGGVYAEAHVRGGGEFGEAWHLAGKGANKPTTWRDFIACVETLEKAGFTSPGKVAGMGVSAGGIMIGRTVTERPDLLAAAVMWVPMVNTLRFETTEGGPANTAEFGSLATPDGYRALKEMDAYSHVVDGVKYPAVLLTGGMNDHRVPVWMAAEMAARLRAASTSGKPVRLRVDFEGGHHMRGASKADQIGQAADTYAFVLQHTGHPGFAAAP